ncbi:MAG TPA: alkaline phosphatase, partial [Ottowia sp.]|nr:alkaline phosphatase [Ottowia sp.]
MQPSVELSSRRRVLKLLGGAPMLPLASSLSAAGLLTACGGDGGSTPSYVSASFSNMAAPSLASPAAMATTTTT